MKPPIFNPEKVFLVLPTMGELVCYYCTDTIDPNESPEFIRTNFENEPHLNFHPLCLDQYAWTAFHFLVKYNQREKKVELIH